MTRQDLDRQVTLLLLMPAEAELLEAALRQFRATNGGGYTRLRDNVLEMLETARFTDHELGRLGDLAAPR
jgi:hypothetical protein